MYKIAITLSLFLFVQSGIFAQTFAVGHASLTLTDATRNNRSVAVEVYYPADAVGDNVPFTSANTQKFPVLGFGHGFVMTYDAYKYLWETLVPKGYIVALSKSEGSLSPSHAEFGKDLAFLLHELTQMGDQSGTIWYGRVDTMNCVMGHSMGGGASFLAAAGDPFIKTIANLAPAETNPSAVQAAAGLTIPALVIAGGNDCITPIATNQGLMYDSLHASCKTFINILGGSHCQMADYSFTCAFGENTCTPAPSITREEQHTIINRYLVPWLDFQLKGNCDAGTLFDSLIVTDPAIQFQKTCLLCESGTATSYVPDPTVKVFPNPFRDTLSISVSDNRISEVVLYTVDGGVVLRQSFTGSTILHTSQLPTGTYCYKVRGVKGKVVKTR